MGASLKAADKEQLFMEKLLDSGEYERLKAMLRQRLKERGWFDEVNQMAMGWCDGSNWDANQQAEEFGGVEDPNFEKLSTKIEPKAMEMVPQEVKLEMLKDIKKFLEGVVEKEK